MQTCPTRSLAATDTFCKGVPIRGGPPACRVIVTDNQEETEAQIKGDRKKKGGDMAGLMDSALQRALSLCLSVSLCLSLSLCFYKSVVPPYVALCLFLCIFPMPF